MLRKCVFNNLSEKCGLSGLEIGLDSETELIDEDLLEGIKVVLLIEDKKIIT